MLVKLFLLGRPGCGKSSAAKHIIERIEREGWSTKRFKDFDILKEMSKEKRYLNSFKKTFYNGYEGFDVLDKDVFDVALQRLDVRLYSYLSTNKQHEIILIEFSRDDYAKALQHFSSLALHGAYFLFIDAYLDTCIQRVKQRMIQPASSDDHYVSEEAIQKFYTKQDLPNSNLLPGKLEKIDNYGSWQDFTKKIDNFTKDVFK